MDVKYKRNTILINFVDFLWMKLFWKTIFLKNLINENYLKILKLQENVVFVIKIWLLEIQFSQTFLVLTFLAESVEWTNGKLF